MRSVLASNLVTIGGTSILQGFNHRLLAEVHQLLKKPKYREDLAVTMFKIHEPPSQANYTAWLGGKIPFHLALHVYIGLFLCAVHRYRVLHIRARIWGKTFSKLHFSNLTCKKSRISTDSHSMAAYIFLQWVLVVIYSSQIPHKSVIFVK